ncbi:cupin domain-containing protein [Staphylococcus cohnii]|uniref:cupin domain-containing protein n=1 Tax=Staphylococcus cohnii TaxID=29382 RepID=UPI003AF8797A
MKHDIQLVRFGVLNQDNHYLVTHKDADDVWIVLQGEGTFFTNDNEQKPIKAGDIFVSFPGDAHGMTNTGDEDFVMLGFATPMPLDFNPYECAQ